jgi:CRP-like cAMP-binding protein
MLYVPYLCSLCLDDDAPQDLPEMLTMREVEETLLFQHGDKSDAMYFILSGRVA